MFGNTVLGGMNLGFPDVCNTPGPVGPIPVPYLNVSQGNMCDPTTAALSVLTSGGPSMNMGSVIPLSSGDNAGAAGGVASGMMMGPTTGKMGSASVIIEGLPGTRLTGLTGQNGMSPNCPGVTLVPSQVTVMYMK
ncbi:PAAR-like domain-containing protein [uncultured Shewanella sp.]|uniref:PAAR-like domain-containing protein n=1 Tax=uncultured Shewanella sp. TaxID=173975 RepID=UPI0026049B30|nr:PAAR-like domain-containing protein [uncultured Shewanella sp.]